jgi:hypothetical protein
MRRRLLPLALLAAFAVVPLAGSGTAAAKSCSDFQVNNGYVTNLSVKGVSCSTGKKVAREHYNKRRKRGGWDGKYNGSVRGYSCRETNRNKSSVELNGRVVCKRGGKRITFFYQSNR